MSLNAQLVNFFFHHGEKKNKQSENGDVLFQFLH